MPYFVNSPLRPYRFVREQSLNCRIARTIPKEFHRLQTYGYIHELTGRLITVKAFYKTDALQMLQKDNKTLKFAQVLLMQ